MSVLLLVIIVFALGYALATWYQLKKAPDAQVSPQRGEQPAPPVPSPLENKIWYEAELDFLFKFNEKLSLNLTYQDTVRCISEAAHDFLPVERAALLTWDKNTEKLTLASAVGWNRDRGQGPLVVGLDSISGFAIRNRGLLLVPDLAQDEYLSKLKKEEFLQKTFISAPIIYNEEVLGVLHVCGKRTGGAFTQEEGAVLLHIVRMGAIALQNVRLYEQVSNEAAELKLAYDKLKDMQDKLIQSEKLKAIGQLASGVAHDMRNPLGIITQGVVYLEQIIPQDAKDQRETLSMIRDSVERADKIVVSLLDFSRATRLELRPEDINLILESSLALVKKELKDIKVNRETAEGLPKITLDKNKLTQVFINLFINASHAMPQGGTLTVRAFLKDNAFQDADKGLVVEIEDTGTGIPEENLKEIFNPFFTTKGRGKGTGLGLSIVQNIINMHSGAIEVKSELNKGTRFIITLRRD